MKSKKDDKEKDKDKDKDKKDKKKGKRYLSPSFKKGGIKEPKQEGENLFKLDLMDAEEEEDASPSPVKKPQKRLSAQEDLQNFTLEGNIDPDTNYKHRHSQQMPAKKSGDELKTFAIKGGHPKKIASLSQAGKGEDGFTKVNQDSFLIIKKEYKLDDFNIFAVMDGHGENGHLVSQFVTKFFTSFFKKNKKLNCLTTEDDIYFRLQKNNFDIIHKAFHHAEKDIVKHDIDANFSGTTCVMVFQTGKRLVTANVGDSRGIICKKDKAIPLSIDQKPNDPEEEKRIKSLGGEISQYEEDGEKSGPFRVWKKGEMFPGIAMSRSIGDLLASTLGVIPEPVVREETIDEDTKFIIIASDGVWEFLSNEDVCEIVQPYYQKDDPEGACRALIKKSTEWWNKEDIVVDDITAIAVFF